MRTFSQTPEWSIVTELKKQYDVSSVSPDAPISSDLNVLLVAQPSSLTQKQIDNLTDYIKKGGGALLFLDPFPVDNPQMSPELPKMPPGGPFGGGQPPEPKGNLRPLLDLVGLDWPSTEIVWNVYNPHPKLADLQSTPEIVFIGKGSGEPTRSTPTRAPARAFRKSSRSFPGMLRPKAGVRARVHPALADRPDGRHDPLERGRPAGLHGHQRHQSPAPAYSHGHELHAGRPAHRPAPGRGRSADKTKDADKKKDDKADAGRRPRSMSSRSPTST